MEAPIEIKPRYADTTTTTTTQPTAPQTQPVIVADAASTETSMMDSIYANKLIVLIVVIAILIIAFVAYFWLRPPIPTVVSPAASPALQTQAQPDTTAGSGVSGDATTDAASATSQPIPPQSAAPQTQPAQTSPSKAQLEAMMNKTKAVAAQVQSASTSTRNQQVPIASPIVTPPSIPGSKTEDELTHIMMLGNSYIAVAEVSGGTLPESRVTDVTDEVATVESEEEIEVANDDISPWLQTDIIATLPDQCSYILPSSKQCRNKPKIAGRCTRHAA